MRNRIRKSFSVIIAVLMLFGVMGVNVMATESEVKKCEYIEASPLNHCCAYYNPFQGSRAFLFVQLRARAGGYRASWVEHCVHCMTAFNATDIWWRCVWNEVIIGPGWWLASWSAEDLYIQ